jgi:hypothetical protein
VGTVSSQPLVRRGVSAPVSGTEEGLAVAAAEQKDEPFEVVPEIVDVVSRV